jgi:hypothetical protein
MTKRILVGMVATAIAGGVVSAQDLGDRVLLRYKWNAGEQGTWLVSGELTGSAVTRDLTQEPPSEESDGGSFTVESVVYHTVDAVTEEGTGTVTYQIGTVDMEAQLNDGSKHYMSIQGQEGRVLVDGAEEPGDDPIMAALMQPVAMVLSSRGELLTPARALYLDELIIAACSPARALQIMRGSQLVLPEPPIGVGYAWTYTMQTVLKPESHGGEAPDEDPQARPKATLTMVYTLAGLAIVEGVECATIRMAGALDLDEPLESPPFEAEPGIERSTGALHASVHGLIYLDPEAGRVMKAEADTILRVRRDTFKQVTEGDQTRQVKIGERIDELKARTTLAWVEPG